MAEELLGLGTRVLITARNADEVAQVVAAWTSRSLPAVGIAADVSAEAGRTDIFAQARTHLQGLDLFVNNVGTNVRKGFNDYTPVEYERLFQVNLLSTVEMWRAAYPWLKASTTPPS